MPIVNVLLLSILIEAVVSAIKPLWSKGSERMSVSEIVSIFLGIVLAVSCRLNVMEYLAEWEVIADAPPFVYYIFYILTGIALGRGPSFLWDLWQRLRKVIDQNEIPAIMENTAELQKGDIVLEDLSYEALVSFCVDNGLGLPDNMPAGSKETRRIALLNWLDTKFANGGYVEMPDPVRAKANDEQNDAALEDTPGVMNHPPETEAE